MRARIIIFGCGELGKRTFDYVGGIGDVCYFCDNDIRMVGKECCGIEVISYEELLRCKKQDDDIIILVCANNMHSTQISVQLVSDGIYDFVVMDRMEDKCISAETLADLQGYRYRMKLSYAQVFEMLREEMAVNEYLRHHIDASAIKPATGELRELQLARVRFCREVLDFLDANCPVQCWAQDGVLLGKLRHNGFIPWDDDVDMGILRKDLKKLILFFNDYSVVYIPDVAYENRWEENQDGLQKAMKAYKGRYIMERLPEVCRIWKENKDGEWLVLEFFVYDYYRNDMSLEQYKELARIGNEMKDDRLQVTDVIKNTDSFIEDSSYISLEKTDVLMQGIDNFMLKGLWNVEYLIRTSDIFPVKQTEFEGEILPFPNNPQRFLELSYKEWKELPADIGRNHRGVILSD